jgi:DNA polymerase-4
MRKFIHIDMDCFYAAVEMRDNPSLRNKPIAIGGRSRRGVLSTANYIARQYGVRAAMSNYKALQLCPDLVLVPGRMEVYRDVSSQIRSIFARYTDLIEPLSLDEAFLDVTDSKACQGSATFIANQIRTEIEQETGLTASAGIAPIKFLAKIASDENKPNGYCVIAPHQVEAFLLALDLKKIPGVGKVTLEKLHANGFKVGKDVVSAGYNNMVARFGNFGGELFRKCNGEIIGRVNTSRERKSLSVEHTYEYDKTSLEACLNELPVLYEELIKRLEKRQLLDKITKLTVKVKFNDFIATTADQIASNLDISVLAALMEKAYARGGKKGVRLLGVGVGICETHGTHNQMQLAII